jgi:hypothetical protein
MMTGKGLEGSDRGLIETLHQHFRGKVEENYESLSQDSKFPAQDPNHGLSKYGFIKKNSMV